MFAGGRRRTSSIRVMQLFHELKQQFPTVPDHIVSACIANYTSKEAVSNDIDFRDALEAAIRSSENQELMGRTLTKPVDPTLSSPISEPSLTIYIPTATDFSKPMSQELQRSRSEMSDSNDSDSDINSNVVIKPNVFYSKETESVCVSPKILERPTHLNIHPDGNTLNKIQPSERCFDLQKLLISENNLNEKPPRSPLNAKRFVKTPATPSPRRETVETPTQTTETLMGGVNLSLNVNCQMDLVQSPTLPKHCSVLHVTPQLPWCQEPASPRSYTSVNLTLRPPSSQPQAPIDITSQNSSLTYSTSSFDSQNGLQSRLQITVGAGGGSVSSFRTRPNSSYYPEVNADEAVPVRTGSLPNLTAETKLTVIPKQRARIENLRIELISERGRLVTMQEEIALLEIPNSGKDKVDNEVEKQLLIEIGHLRGQCERLAFEIDRHSETGVPLCETNEEFYRHIYTGQHSRLTLGTPFRISNPQENQLRSTRTVPQAEMEDSRWNCHLCTFQNHPLLDKCEECDMPRILHGMKSEPPNPCLVFGMIRPLGESGPYNPNRLINNNGNSIAK